MSARPQHEKLFVASLALSFKKVELLPFGMIPKKLSNPKEMFQVTQCFELWKSYNDFFFLFFLNGENIEMRVCFKH